MYTICIKSIIAQPYFLLLTIKIHHMLLQQKAIYRLSDSGGKSQMKVSFPLSSQSILRRLSRNFVTIIIK